ncbi:hypothetical protein YC2023_016496 [Brassica napus]
MENPVLLQNPESSRSNDSKAIPQLNQLLIDPQMKPEELTAFALAGNMQVNKFRKKQENDGRFRSKA